MSQTKFTNIAGFGTIGMWQIFRTKVMIKASLDVNILFIFKTKKLEKCMEVACTGTEIKHSFLVHHLVAAEIKILFLKLTIALNLNLSAK